MSSDFCIKCDKELSVYCGPCVDAVRAQAEGDAMRLSACERLIPRADYIPDRSTAENLEIVITGLMRERDKARQDFIALADALGMVSRDDTGRIGMVASVEEAVYAAVEAVRKANKWDDVQESLDMACENPPPNCECPGCSYAREKGGAK